MPFDESLLDRLDSMDGMGSPQQDDGLDDVDRALRDLKRPEQQIPEKAAPDRLDRILSMTDPLSPKPKTARESLLEDTYRILGNKPAPATTPSLSPTPSPANSTYAKPGELRREGPLPEPLTQVNPEVIERRPIGNESQWLDEEPPVNELSPAPAAGARQAIGESMADITRFFPFVKDADMLKEVAGVTLAIKRLRDKSAPDREQDDLRLVKDYLDRKDMDARKNKTFWYTVIDGLSRMPAFMGEMALTWGTYTAGKTVAAKGMTKLSPKLVEKMLSHKLGTLGLKSAVGIAGATAQTIPLSLAKAPKQFLERTMPDIKITGEEKNKLEMMIAGEGEDILPAIKNSLGDTWIEVLSEHSGGMFGGLAKPLKNVVMKTALFNAFAKAHPGTRVKDFMALVKKTGWNGIIGEFGEERLGDVGRAGLGIEQFTVSPKQYLAELAMFSVPGAGVAATNYALTRGDDIPPGGGDDTAAPAAQTEPTPEPPVRAEKKPEPPAEPEPVPPAEVKKKAAKKRIQPEVVQEEKVKPGTMKDFLDKYTGKKEEPTPKPEPPEIQRGRIKEEHPTTESPKTEIVQPEQAGAAEEGEKAVVEPTKEAWETSALATTPNISADRISSKKQPDGTYKLFYQGTRNEVFEGKAFKDVRAARNFFTEQKKKAQAAQSDKPAKEAGTKEQETKTTEEAEKPYTSKRPELQSKIIDTITRNKRKYNVIKYADGFMKLESTRKIKGKPVKVIPYDIDQYKKYLNRKVASSKAYQKRKADKILIKPNEVTEAMAILGKYGNYRGELDIFEGTVVGTNYVGAKPLVSESDSDNRDKAVAAYNVYAREGQLTPIDSYDDLVEIAREGLNTEPEKIRLERDKYNGYTLEELKEMEAQEKEYQDQLKEEKDEREEKARIDRIAEEDIQEEISDLAQEEEISEEELKDAIDGWENVVAASPLEEKKPTKRRHINADKTTAMFDSRDARTGEAIKAGETVYLLTDTNETVKESTYNEMTELPEQEELFKGNTAVKKPAKSKEPWEQTRAEYVSENTNWEPWEEDMISEKSEAVDKYTARLVTTGKTRRYKTVPSQSLKKVEDIDGVVTAVIYDNGNEISLVRDITKSGSNQRQEVVGLISRSKDGMEHFAITPEMRGKGYGQILLDKAKGEGWDIETAKYHTSASNKALHRNLVKQALREGNTVPSNVLKDYPDIKAKLTKKKLPPPDALSGTINTETGQDSMMDGLTGQLNLFSVRPRSPHACGVTLADIKEMYPGAEITKDAADSYILDYHGHRIKIKTVQAVRPDSVAFRVGYKRPMKPGETIAGKYTDGTITITKQGDKYTMAHESWHYLRDKGIVNTADIRAIRFAAAKKTRKPLREVTEEDEAAYIESAVQGRAAEQKGFLRRAVSKVRDFIDGLVNLFHRTATGVVRGVETGKAYATHQKNRTAFMRKEVKRLTGEGMNQLQAISQAHKTWMEQRYKGDREAYVKKETARLRREGNGLFEAIEEAKRNWRERFGETEQSVKYATKKKTDQLSLFPPLEIPDETKVQRLIRNLQNKMNRLEQVQKIIGNIPENMDAALRAELYIGRASDKIDRFRKTFISGKDSYFERLAKDGFTHEDIGMYLYAKHAGERDDHIQEINKKFAEGGSGMPEDIAEKILTLYADTGLDKYAQEFYEKVTKPALKMKLDAELITQDLYDALTGGYQNYVPLKGNAEREFRRKIGKGFSVTGKDIIKAKGRRSMANNPFVQALLDYEDTIIRAEKNKVMQTLMKMVAANPSDMWSIESLKYMPRYDKFGEIEFLDPHYKYADNVLEVKVKGKVKYITINDKAMAEGLKNMGTGRGIKVLQDINTYLRMVNTIINPEFLITNFERDLQTALVHMTGDQTTAFAAKTTKNIPAAMKGIMSNLRGKDKGLWADLYTELKEIGGKVGWFDMRTLEEKTEALTKQIEHYKRHKIDPRKALGGAVELISDANEMVEMAVRLSTYKSLIDAGTSKDKAAQYAKNLTVNFNKMGNWGAIMNSLWLFSNAGIQGSARIAKAMGIPFAPKTRGQKRTQAIVAGIIATSLLQGIINRLINEDEYDQMSAYNKDNYWLGMLPSGKTLAVKVPYGYNVFHVLGNVTEEIISGKATLPEAGKRLLGAFNDAFNPLGGGSFAQFLSPTVFDPIIQIKENKNFYGGPLHKEQPAFQAKKPDSQLYFRNVRPTTKAFTTWLNSVTGGNETVRGKVDFNPENIDHLVDFMGGGLGKFIANSLETGKSLIKDGDFPPANNVPIVRQMVKEPTEWMSMNRVYDMLAESGRTVYSEHMKYRFNISLARALKKGTIEIKDVEKHLNTFNRNQMQAINSQEREKRLANKR